MLPRLLYGVSKDDEIHKDAATLIEDQDVTLQQSSTKYYMRP